MKVGLVSDIHGNANALLRAFELMGDVDQVLCLGDSISQHTFSNDVVRILRDRDIPTIWGNHEAIFFSDLGERARAAKWIDPELMAWLGDRPQSIELNLAGKTVLMVHATPLQPYGEYVHGTGREFRNHFSVTKADVVVCGHTHQPSVRHLDATMVVNPGSTGEGRPTDVGFTQSCASVNLLNDEVEIFDFII